ncbi:MAG: GTP-binding protein [Alphaproteobacteria bacterium]|nr:GTP-binding protein [Alphaproteobacteria bacterium]
MIPLTVIGGYLGAGKTTLINSLLSAGHGRRLAVLVNDFGAVNIDRDLIVRHDGDTIALSNGCVCCSITDALGTALDKVIALGPDNIVIEASGVADPAKIAYYGQGWPGVQLDAVAVLVDAASIRNRAGDKFVGELVQRQLDAGDILLLSKTDLISRQELRGVRGWLAARTLKSPMVELRHGSAPADLLLETGAGRSETVRADANQDHDRLFTSVLLQDHRPLDRATFMAEMANWPDQVLRAKGFVRFSDDITRAYSLQRVGARCSLEAYSRRDDAPAGARIVIIGPRNHLDIEALGESLRRSLATDTKER